MEPGTGGYWRRVDKLDYYAKHGKKCRRCKAVLPATCFGIRSREGCADTLLSACKPCLVAAANERAARDPDNARRIRRRHSLRKSYGLTEDAYAEMVNDQGGRCAVCGEAPRPTGNRIHGLHVDHDHATGAVRGLLCDNCNRGLGHFGDAPDVLESAAAYVRRSRAA